MSPTSRIALAGLACVLLAPALCRADIEDLTLFQKTARSDLVVKVRALSDSTRRPEMEVLQVLKGTYREPRLTIVPFAQDNTNPSPWLSRSVFSKGEESVLFLVPYRDEFGRDDGPDRFSILSASAGKIEIPAEGGSALETAVETFVGILDMRDHDKQAEAFRGLLTTRNPHMLEAGLDECRRFRLASIEDLVALVNLLESPRPDFRSGALSLLMQVVSDSRVAGTSGLATALSDARVFDHVAAAGSLDEDEDVRREAVRVLEAIGDNAALALIEKIGRADASQDVRYQAQVAAHRLRSKLIDTPQR